MAPDTTVAPIAPQDIKMPFADAELKEAPPRHKLKLNLLWLVF